MAVAQENNTTEVDLCAGVTCDDANECTLDTCSEGVCSYTPSSDGAPCAQGTCKSGLCEAEELIESDNETTEVRSVCGDGTCDVDETADACPDDCRIPEEQSTIMCGNGVCETGEDASVCESDCAPHDLSAVCGNNACEDGENSDNCADDCGRKEPEQVDLRSLVQASVSGTSKELANSILADISSLTEKARAFSNSPSSTTAYDLAYASRLAEGKLRGYVTTYSQADVDAASTYVVIHGQGNPDLWIDEFGNVQVGGLWAYESTTRQGVRVRFDRWYDKFEAKTWINLRAELSQADTRAFAEDIKRARRNAEDEARALEVAGQLKDYLATFSISEANKKTAKELLLEIESIVNTLNSLRLSNEAVYNIVYTSELLRAKIEGISQTLDCTNLREVGEYIILYGPGRADIYTDEFGDQQLNTWKELYKNEEQQVGFNFNMWGCNLFEDQGGMGVDLQLGRGLEQFKESIQKARKDSFREAEALRRHGLVLQARESYDFSFEVEELGDEIINNLKEFKEKILAFEAGEESAYNLHYASVILRATLEGLGEALPELSENVGTYIVLYGPGVPDVWNDFQTDELFVGHNLAVHQTDNLQFNFNRWFDEFQGRGGFSSWLDWGKQREQYREEIKQAEQDAWREADKMRKSALASKMRIELEGSVDENTTTYVNAIKEFVSVVQQYRLGQASAYDVEFKRLQASDLMRDIDKVTRDYVMVSNLGSDVMPPDIWLDWQTDEINIGGWRELITEESNDSRKFRVIASMDGWCNDFGDFSGYGQNFECRVEARMNWRDWNAVKRDLRQANDYFWKQKREAELGGVLTELSAKATEYSTQDQRIIADLTVLFAEVLEKAQQLDTRDIEAFQYEMLLKQDALNDKLDEASDESLVIVSGAKSSGFHDYDTWNKQLYGVSVFNNENVEVVVRFNQLFGNMFRQDSKGEDGVDYEIIIDLIWKEWSDELSQHIKNAFERYEQEQSAVRFEKLRAKRTEIANELSTSALTAKIEEYENGEVSMTELRQHINSLYFKLQGYDNELAYFAAISQNAFPEFEPIIVEIETEHVKLKLQERDFEYRFGAGIGAVLTRQGFESAGEAQRKFEFAPVDVQREVNVQQASQQPEERNSITGNQVFPVGEQDKQGQEQFFDENSVEIYSDDVADFIEKGRAGDIDERKRIIEELQSNEQDFFSHERVVTRVKNSEDAVSRVRIEGIKPKLSLSIEMTDAEILRLAQEVKAQWLEMEASGALDDALYNLNLGLDNMPEVQDAIREWGDTTTSVRLRYQNESIFELSFKIEDGNVAWMKYGVAQNAGDTGENVYLEIDFESVMRLRNWWEERLRNAEGIGDFITAIPAFGGRLIGMFVGGEITVQPFNTVFKIPRFINVFFTAMAPTAGLDI
ncbi:hypothetical protein COT72_02350 [archaeon CG10_big_fil_rev_8_21_14_0_10_43_11]|nr:MAG: hypothetical protein COT72_02350 [archaeon CG10_big_fil_rev_8_21_14_0_10_43_11]